MKWAFFDYYRVFCVILTKNYKLLTKNYISYFCIKCNFAPNSTINKKLKNRNETNYEFGHVVYAAVYWAKRMVSK